MATSITLGSTTLYPKLVVGWESTRRTGNIIHPVLGTGAPSVTFAPTSLRTGTLNILVLTMAEALAMEALHAQEGVLSLVDPDQPGVNMLYVPSGDISMEIDEHRQTWRVTVDYQEVTV